MSKFEDDLEKAYKKKVIGGVENAVKKAALFLDGQLVQRTPVDTGRARSNWLASLGNPKTEAVEATQAAQALGRNSSIISKFNVLLNKTVFIANNLPYITRLNEGSSNQAPAGFVDDAIMVTKASIK
jgi:hypothetical protein